MRYVSMKTTQTSHDPGTELIEQVMSGLRLVGYLMGGIILGSIAVLIWFL